jgi:four helix bundle protein
VTVKRFEDLDAWKDARAITKDVYSMTREGVFAKDYALVDQMRRAAISIMSNIAEGFESRTQALFIEFLGRAKASSGELRSQCYTALDNAYITNAQFQVLRDRLSACSARIQALMRYLESVPNSRRIAESDSGYHITDPQSILDSDEVE